MLCQQIKGVVFFKHGEYKTSSMQYAAVNTCTEQWLASSNYAAVHTSSVRQQQTERAGQASLESLCTQRQATTYECISLRNFYNIKAWYDTWPEVV